MASEYLVNPVHDDCAEDCLVELENRIRSGKPFKVIYKNATMASIGQKALFHIWCREMASHFMNIPASSVTEDEEESVKASIKKAAYTQNRWPWMIYTKRDVFTGEEKKDYKSIGSLGVGEMYNLMEFTQMIAAEQGLILEAVGEYKRLKDDSE
tara:strand:- start:47 stop:508 length:462 start_codon:yes stop_codon:yes gene_type:complete